MRALRSCDFCGDDAVGTFEVVPDELLQTEADQRRVALCSHCHDTLDTVLEPFLAGVDDSEVRVEGETSPTKSPVPSERRATSDGDHHENDEGTTTPQHAATDADARAEGIAIGRRDSEGERADASEDEALDDVETDNRDDESEVAEGEAPVDHDERPSRAEEPDQFRKVMRLLSNREFPVDRAEFAELTAGAYEMDEDHVADIIDHAVGRGVIADDDGTLRKN